MLAWTMNTSYLLLEVSHNTDITLTVAWASTPGQKLLSSTFNKLLLVLFIVSNSHIKIWVHIMSVNIVGFNYDWQKCSNKCVFVFEGTSLVGCSNQSWRTYPRPYMDSGFLTRFSLFIYSKKHAMMLRSVEAISSLPVLLDLRYADDSF